MSQHMNDRYSHVNKVCHLGVSYVSDDYFLLLMLNITLFIILYVPVVLGKVYDSKRPGKELTPLKISPLQPIYRITPDAKYILRFLYHDDKEHN